MKVFITGGAGFIGSHLCDYYVKNRSEVTVLDNFTTGSLKNIAHLEHKINLINGDIRDQRLVEKLVKKSDLVLHLAAAVGVRTILEEPVESMSVNFTGSEIVLKACSKFNKRVIITSTSEIYGKNPKQPLKETDDRVMGTPQKIRWSYADAKALEEALAHSLFLSDQLRVTTVRLFNTVGTRQSSQYGMVIPNFIEAALQNKPIMIFGDGLQSRVFCHISDVVKALIVISECDKLAGEVFNVGGKLEIAILDLAKLIIKLTNSNSEITFTDYESAYGYGYEDMTRRSPDITKIKNQLNWAPIISLEDIIKEVATQYRN
jgi:UDP-glucose 4-epimerase